MARKNLVLLVDDEVNILRFVSARLRKEQFDVLTATSGAEALAIAEAEDPGLVILDIAMPGINGFEVCRQLRQWSQAPIIMLSARFDENDKVKCLDLGADDYVTKPFGADELLARVKAVLRRTSGEVCAGAEVTCGDLKISFEERQATVGGRPVKLTRTEFNLLRELSLNAGKVLTHTYLLQKVWGAEYGVEKEYIHEFMRRLRLKLEADKDHPRYIICIPGVGYRLGGETEP